MRLIDLCQRAMVLGCLVAAPIFALGSGENTSSDGGLTSGGRSPTSGGLGSAPKTSTPVTTTSASLGGVTGPADDPALKAQFEQLKQMCSQMKDGGSGGSSSSLSSGSSGGGGEGGEGGGGSDAWLKRENCKKAEGGGKCWHVTAVANGGGFVGAGGYNGRSKVLEKYLKEEAERALKMLQEACELTAQTQMSGTLDNSPANQKLMYDAIGKADGAANIFGRVGEIEMPLVMPIMKAFPSPLAPMATQNDVRDCKKDNSCKQQCTQSGDKLKKVSGECVTKLDEITQWYIKKKQEALGLKEAWKTALAHMMGKGGQIAMQPMPPPKPSTNIIDAIPPVQAKDPNEGTNARNLFVPESDGGEKKSTKDSSDSGFAGGAPSSSSTNLAAGDYTPVDTANNSLGGTDDGPADQAGAQNGNLASGQYEAAGAEDLDSGGGGNNQYNGPKAFLGHLVGYGIETDQRSAEMAVAGGTRKAAADRFHITNGLSMARERVVTTKDGKQELKLEQLTLFERGSRGLYGADGHRAVGFANHEQRLKSARSAGIRPASATTQGRK